MRMLLSALVESSPELCAIQACRRSFSTVMPCRDCNTACPVATLLLIFERGGFLLPPPTYASFESVLSSSFRLIGVIYAGPSLFSVMAACHAVTAFFDPFMWRALSEQ
eukprot:6193751-Pleurochrysis_carterae.AAC.3